LEPGSEVPVVIMVVPLHPGDYGVKLQPQEDSKRVGSGTSGTVTVSP